MFCSLCCRLALAYVCMCAKVAMISASIVAVGRMLLTLSGHVPNRPTFLSVEKSQPMNYVHESAIVE